MPEGLGHQHSLFWKMANLAKAFLMEFPRFGRPSVASYWGSLEGVSAAETQGQYVR